MAVTPEQVLLAVGSALAYSLVFYAKNRAGDPEDFKPKKLLATLIVGLAVGIGYGLAGVEITQELIFAQLSMYAGTTALVESIIKAIYRQIKEGSNATLQ
jgi:hypothetical protein